MGTSTTETRRGSVTTAVQRQTIIVEFGPLTAEQRAFVARHTLRAVGGGPRPLADDNGELVEFWLRDGETVDALYDDVRGWAIGNGLPVRGFVDNGS